MVDDSHRTVEYQVCDNWDLSTIYLVFRKKTPVAGGNCYVNTKYLTQKYEFKFDKSNYSWNTMFFCNFRTKTIHFGPKYRVYLQEFQYFAFLRLWSAMHNISQNVCGAWYFLLYIYLLFPFLYSFPIYLNRFKVNTHVHPLFWSFYCYFYLFNEMLSDIRF